MVPILLAQPAGEAERGHRVRVGLGPGVPAAAQPGVSRAHRRRACRRLRLDRDQLRHRQLGRRAARRHDGLAAAGLRGARRRRRRRRAWRPAQAGELVLRAEPPFAFASGYFNRPEETVEAWRNVLVPHRRPRRPRRRRRVPLRRPAEGLDPPARREHLVVRGRAGAARPSRRRGRRRLPGALRARRRRGHGRARRPGRPRHRRRRDRPPFCESRLPRFAIPRYIDVVAELPRTENGKVQKFKLSERGVTATAWDRDASAPAPDSRSVARLAKHGAID